MIKQFILILFLCFTANWSVAQDQDAENFDDNSYGDIVPLHQVSLELGLPNGAINKPFSSMMQGLVNIAPYYQFTLKNKLAFGVGVNYAFFKINQFRVPGTIHGGMNHYGAFARVAYEQFHSMRFGTEYSVKMGYNTAQIYSDSLKAHFTTTTKNYAYIAPTAAVILTNSEWTSYRFYVSYTFTNMTFSPFDLGANTASGYEQKEFDRKSQFLTVGFGFTYYFKQRN